MKVLAVIPARAGSKGIPGKNTRLFLGRPLIAWTIDAALASGVCDDVIVSTDSEEIAAVARAAGASAPFLRPPALAADTAPTAPVLRHAIDWMLGQGRTAPDAVLVLEPTSPGRQPSHIREGATWLATAGVDSVASVSRAPHHYVPEKILERSADGRLTGRGGVHVRDMIHRRQDLAPAFAFDGILFGCRAACLLAEVPTIWGQDVRSFEVASRFVVDLDEPEDWAPAEARLRPVLLGEGAHE